MCGCREKGLVLVLPVKVDERPDLLGKRADGRHLTVEEAAAPSVRAHAAPDEQVSTSGDEPALDERLRRATPHGPAVAALPHEQFQRPEQRGLAGTRLARKHGHTGSELQPRVLDEREVPDVELLKHRRPRRTPTRACRRSDARRA